MGHKSEGRTKSFCLLHAQFRIVRLTASQCEPLPIASFLKMRQLSLLDRGVAITGFDAPQLLQIRWRCLRFGGAWETFVTYLRNCRQAKMSDLSKVLDGNNIFIFRMDIFGNQQGQGGGSRSNPRLETL